MGYIGGIFGNEIHMGDRDIGNVNWEANLNDYQETIFYVAGSELGMCFQPFSEFPNPKLEGFIICWKKQNSLYGKDVYIWNYFCQ